MKQLTALLTALMMAVCVLSAAAEETVPGFREMLETPTATPAPDAFGVGAGRLPGDAKVAVSRFTADLVFMFRQDRLAMISYEFQRKEPAADFTYLCGALSTVYGEKTPADPAAIKNLMDAINPNRYKTEAITEAYGWTAADGTAIYLYYFSPEAFAVLYVSHELGAGIYQTNGL